jgi:hypothetical protein
MASLLLVVVLCSYCCYIAHAGDEHGFVVVPRRSYEPEAVCSVSLGAPSDNTSAFVFTPMGHLPGWPTFYMVNMTGISVGGKPLDIPQSAFRGGMVIDCGTHITELPETAYNALEAALRKALAAYPMVASEDYHSCYNFTGYSNVTVPRVALTFSGGATIDLDVPNGILVKDCLAFRELGPASAPSAT